MKRRKKLSIALLVLLLISQIPFAYRRYRLGCLNAAVQQLKHVVPAADDRYNEYRGVIHVHSFLGGHSSGNFQEIIQAARLNGLDFVLMTEHPAREFNTAEMTLRGIHAGILFVNGNEITTSEGDRLLVIPGDTSVASVSNPSTATTLAKARANKSLSVVAYPEKFIGWTNDGYDCVEVYNVYTNARQINPIIAFFDSLWSYRSYHDLLFATFYTRPSEALTRWDEASRRRKVVGVAGNDAHANIGLSLDDASGNTVIGLKLDPYETSFHLVHVHSLIAKSTPFDSASLIEALAMGHCFIGFDLFGDSSGFSFTATNSVDHRIQGDEIQLLKEIRLRVGVPISARIVLFKNGLPSQEEIANEKEFVVAEKGIYRVEVYLPQLGQPIGVQPWIISNPIYVR